MKERKIIRKECTVGSKCWYEDEPNNVWYESGCTENGYCFKDTDAFNSKSDDICYIPENSDYFDDNDNEAPDLYKYQDILDACDGVPTLAERVFHQVDWQYPETLLMEWSNDSIEESFYLVVPDEDANSDFINWLSSNYSEEDNGNDWHNFYDFYLKSKKIRYAVYVSTECFSEHETLEEAKVAKHNLQEEYSECEVFIVYCDSDQVF